MRQGQAVWQTEGSDLAGEVIFGVGPDQQASLQFIKTPLPIVSAQTDGAQWTVHFAAENRDISGRGTPPQQLIWLHLVNALRGAPPPAGYTFKSDAMTGSWEIANTKSGESISGFVNP